MYRCTVRTLRLRNTPCWQCLPFTFSILAYLRKTLHKSSKLAIVHEVIVADELCWTQAYGRSHLENQFDDWSRYSGFSDFNGITWFRQNLLFSFSLKKTKGGIARRVIAPKQDMKTPKGTIPISLIKWQTCNSILAFNLVSLVICFRLISAPVREAFPDALQSPM